MRTIEMQDADFQAALATQSIKGEDLVLPCTQTDPETFFPIVENADTTKDAKRICRSCPIIVECLKGALARKEPWGVWGGMNTRERNILLKKRHEAA